jgi:hypothetical protein
MKITNAILTAQNEMLREHIGILNDTVRAMETMITRMRSDTGEIPFPHNSSDDGSPWNGPDEDADEYADAPEDYDFGGSEWIDPTSGRDTWHN